MAHYKAHQLQYMEDSLRNLVTGLGTGIDPTTNSTYNFCELDRQQLEAAYRSNWLARAIIDAPAADATREWRVWQAGEEDVEAIEAVEKVHDLQRKTRLAIQRARLYGGAALVLGVDGSGDPREPLDYDRLGEDCLKFVVVLNRWELNAGARIHDAMSPWYSRPEYYTIASPLSGFSLNGDAKQAAVVDVHPSRVIEFAGRELPDWRLAPMGGGWGDSVLQAVDETLKDFGITMGGIAALVNDAKTDIIGVTGLADKLSNKKSSANLYTRFQHAVVGKSTLRALILDKDQETWERHQTTFSGLPDILQQFMTLVSGSATIPVSRLMGSAPGKGLATVGGGDSDLRNYYDSINADQKNEYSPAMTPLDAVVQISALGKLDPSIYYAWNPLYRPDPKDVAAVNMQKMQTTQGYVNMGLFNEDAMRAAVSSQLTEDAVYPGWADAVDEHGLEPEVDPMDTAMQQAQLDAMKAKTLPPAQAQKLIAKDAAPRSLYVRRDVVNAAEIRAWAKTQGFPTTVPADQMHVTVMYSQTPLDWMKIRDDWVDPKTNGQLTIGPGGVRLLEQMGKAVALLFTSSALSWRHESIKDAGAQTDYQDYQPHISLTFDAGNLDWRKVDPYRGIIVLGPEIFEEVKYDESWRDGFTEDTGH